MIFKGSRYTNTEVITPPGADGDSRPVLSQRPIAATQGALIHTVSEGDRLDTLAARYYGDPTKYWVILDANAEPLNPFELLAPGRRIQIPRDRILSE